MGNKEPGSKTLNSPEDLTSMLMGSSFCEDSEREYLACY